MASRLVIPLQRVRAEEGLHMVKYLTGVLTVIAVGVLLVAYGLLKAPTTGAAAMGSNDPLARPVAAGLDAVPSAGLTAAPHIPYVYSMDPATQARPVSPVERPQYLTYSPWSPDGVRAVTASEDFDAVPVRATPRPVVHRAPKRDWVRTALIIGGSSAAGAGVGALIGGKKGALIGAAIGGGATALLQTQKH